MTRSERKEIISIAERFQVVERDVADMYQQGMSFGEIITELDRDF